MSEQTIQDSLYSIPVSILDKYTCLSLGATTVNDLIKTGKLKKIRVSKNFGKKPDVLIINKNKEVVVLLEFKTPAELNSQAKIAKAIKQEIGVAREVGAKIYIVTDGDKYIWLNPLTGNLIVDENNNPITRKVEPKIESKKLAEFIDLVSLVSLNDMITHSNGKASYTKEWCEAHSGDIPVYSANNSSPIAYSDVADYDGKYLTYSKNGCAGFMEILSGRFSVNGDRCVIKLNPGYEHIDLLYLKYYLEPIFRANIKGRLGVDGKNEYTKINSTMIKSLKILVPVPVDTNGDYDLKKQQEMAQKYATIETIKDNIYNQVKALTDIVVV